MVKNFSLLGSTGSIGQQALSVARMHNITVNALSGGKNIGLISRQAREFLPSLVCIADESLYGKLKLEIADLPIKVVCGPDGLLEIAALKTGMTVNALVGMAGLLPTLEAISAGNDIALANKEALVAGGELVMSAVKSKKVKILPVDSEHSAIFQCLMGNNRNEVRKIILTASGGPFFGYSPEMLKKVTREQALKHPNWVMGQKITVDSATMMNKGLELIEAMWLFGIDHAQIETVIHRQSIVHSAVEFIDGSVIAQMGIVDMRIPIQFALSFPDRWLFGLSEPDASGSLSLTEIGKLTFEQPNEETFKCLKLAKQAAQKGGNAGCIINSANERAVAAFLDGVVKFYEIPELIQKAFESVTYIENPTLKQILDTEILARVCIDSALKGQ